MQDLIDEALAQAEALGAQLRDIEDALGHYQGEQIAEDRTEEQLDRWAGERDITKSVKSAAAHLDELVAELQRLALSLSKPSAG